MLPRPEDLTQEALGDIILETLVGGDALFLRPADELLAPEAEESFLLIAFVRAAEEFRGARLRPPGKE